MKNILRKIFGILFVVIAGIFLFLAFQQWKEYQDSIHYYNKIQTENTNDEDDPWINPDWDSVPNAIAWIYACDGKINYPVCYKKEDNQYFLHRTPDGNSSFPGAVFLDGYCSPDLSDPHFILYGHNMRNGTMFQALHKYDTPSYYNKHKYFYIFTRKDRMKFKIFSRHVVSDGSDLYRITFLDQKDKKNWLKTWNNKAEDCWKNGDFANKHICSLSTCTQHGEKRLVIQGFLESVTPQKK